MKTAYPQFQGTTQIRLYSNIPFDNTYQHHSLISKVFKDDNTTIYTAGDSFGLPKERFINRKKIDNSTYYYPRYDISGEFNFDYSNGLVCSVVLELTYDQTNANYLRVYSHDTNGGEYYYYFITGIQQINADTYKLSLELDVLMTYQDEFLNGLEEIPVATKRKHCHRFNGNGYPTCPDFKNSEDAFVGVKPSITAFKTELKLKGGMELLSDVSWLYIAVEPTNDLSGSVNRPYRYKECTHPVTMLCQPYNARVSLDNGHLTNDVLSNDITKLIGEGKVHGCKISPFPPFYDENIVVSKDSNGLYHISSTNLVWHPYDAQGEQHPHWEYTLDDGKTKIYMYPSGTGHDASDLNSINANTFVLQFVANSKYLHKDVTLSNIARQNGLTSNANRILDPRLHFAPFCKYVIASPYASEYEFYPELKYAQDDYDGTSTNVFKFESTTTAYIGDSNITTYVADASFYKYYNYLNIGLSANTNYNIPAGTNALDVFNATQSQAYYQSKTASGITAGITIAGGVGSVVAGAVLGATGYGAPMAVGMIAGGATAIAGGTASAINNAKSVSAKIEDLKNTPDSYNVIGSNYTCDYVRTAGGNMPYVIVYECSKIIKHSANDFFYNYGYAVSRDCYFNVDLANDYDSIDDNLFGRDIFNFIQLNEDITNKINNDMPIIVKQKLSKIFNQGITLWTFFKNSTLWGSTAISTANNPDKWFMKHALENAEYD